MNEEFKKKRDKSKTSGHNTPARKFEIDSDNDFEDYKSSKYQNNYDNDETLRAQLQIARKTCKMQEEEFEFQRNELEKEIANRKKIEKQLRQQLAKLEQDQANDPQMYDVLVKMELEKKKFNDTKAKAAKWKERAKSFEEKNNSIACQTKLLEEKSSNYQNQINEIQSQLIDEKKAHEETEKLREEFRCKYQELLVSFGNLENENKALKLNNTNLEAQMKLKSLSTDENSIIEPVTQPMNQLTDQIIDQYANQMSQLQQSIKTSQNGLIEREQMINEQKNEIEKLNKIIKSYEEQIKQDNEKYHKLQEKLKHNNKKLSKFNQKYEKIKKDNEEKDGLIKKLSKKYEHLNSDFERNMNEISQLANIEKLANERLEQISDIEEQLHKLNSITGSKTDDLHRPWTNLINKIGEIQKIASRVDQLEKENKKLHDHLNIAIGQLNGTIAMKQQNEIQEKSDDELPRALQLMLNQTQNRLEHTTLQLEKNRLRTRFAVLIEKQNSMLVKHINDLHSSLFLEDDSQIRPLILSVLFARRMINIIRQPNDIDPKALSAFSGRQKFSMDCKLREIRNKVTSMTQDMILIKQDLYDAKQKELGLSSEYLNIEETYHKTKATLEQVKQRLKILQEELSTSIPSKEFDQALQRISDLSIEKARLENDVENLNYSIEKQNLDILKSKQRCRKLKSLADSQKEKIHKYKLEKKLKKEDDIMMGNYVRQQTEDIENLEKMLKKSRKREAYAKLNSMNQIPSDHICGTLMDCPVRFGSPFVSPTKIPGKINPEFLGDKE